MNYKKHALAGFSWQTVQKILNTGLSFAKIIILARLLSPQDFGLFSLVMIALGTTESLTQTGVNITIVQSKQEIKYFLNTAWVISIIRGLIIAILMVLSGQLMANYYKEPDLFAMIAIASLVPLIKGFINPAIATWQKHFQFQTDSLYHILRLSFEASVQIALAFYLQSAWALIIGVIFAAIFEVILSFLMCKEKPIFAYLQSRGNEILRNARWLSLSSALHYLNDNIDDFILGKVVGTYRLGIYHNAYAFSHKSNYEFAKSAHHSLMPVFSQLQQERQRLKQAFLKSFWSMAILLGLISIPLIIFPKVFVLLLLGEKWLEASTVLPILTMAGYVHALVNIIYALLVAKKFYFYLNAHLLISLVLLIIGVIVGGQAAGLIGAVYGILLSRLVSAPIVFWGVKKCLS